jgi:protein ImuB
LNAPDKTPHVVAASIESALRLTAVNDAAAQLGLRLGMSLADVRAMYPRIAVSEADAGADRRLLESIADWADRYTPLVGLDPPDGLTLDVTGCAHLFGGESAMTCDLAARLAHQGFHARAAVADSVGCAWAIARFLPPPERGRSAREAGRVGVRNVRPPPQPSPFQGEGAHRARCENADVFIVPHGETHAAMLPLPVASLRIDPEIAAKLAIMGLKCVGDIAARPRAPFAARFGDELLRRLDQALCRADEPITPRLPLPTAMAERRFPDPVAREEDVLGTIEQLAYELSRVLERRGEGARLIALSLFRADGKVYRLELGTGALLREPSRVRRLFEDRLAVLGDTADPGFGFDMIRLSALMTERSDPVQSGLAGPDDGEELAHLIDRLGARFGLRRVTRQVARDTHIPEYAVAAVPAHAAGRAATALSFEQDTLGTARPVRLFERPQPIEVTAEVPDGPPVQFNWRQIKHHVVKAEGPERIAMEWWRDDRGNKLTRDYFRIESRNGMRAWLYREGLYGREISRPRWYLHGLFA